jgi:pentatricopeptide repeat protein
LFEFFFNIRRSVGFKQAETVYKEYRETQQNAQVSLAAWPNNAMMSAYKQGGQPHLALKLYDELRQEKDYVPNYVTYGLVMHCYGLIGRSDQVQEVSQPRYLGHTIISTIT